MESRVIRYMGLAKKAGKLISGVNTCSFAMNKGKVKLMIIAEDISVNSEKKIMKEIRRHKIPYVKYGESHRLSAATGSENRNAFAVCDENFADVILKEIDCGAK